MTVTGRTIGERSGAAVETPGQEVVRPLATPLKPTGGLVILRGNLAPEGCVVKVAGTSARTTAGPARVFDSEESGVRRGPAQAHQGRRRRRHPLRGAARADPGMREMLGGHRRASGAGLGESVALMTDGRFSGATRGFMVGPRRARKRRRRADRRRPRRRHRRDSIRRARLDVELTDDEIKARLATWTRAAARRRPA